MREVVGAFGSFSKLGEALEELCSEGIAPDRVRVSTACAPPSSGMPQSIDGQSSLLRSLSSAAQRYSDCSQTISLGICTFPRRLSSARLKTI
jgi:hypothetical protein